MADRSWSRDDKAATKSPLSTKTMRSQRIAQPTSPVDERDDEDDEALDRSPPPLVRSHTPGHLASRSTDRRRKPSELSIRQRSQSAAGLSSSQTLSSVAPLSSKSHHAPHSASSTATTPNRHTNGEGTTSNDVHRHDSSAGEGRDGSGSGSRNGRRPPALRSTSAIASKSGTGGIERSVSSAVLRNLSISQAAGRNAYTAFPPLVDPKTAPDVPAAPSSGMYWSRAPVSGHPHTALRAHTTTLVGSSVYVFGGCDSRACFNELYVLDADAFYWTAPHVVGDVPVPLRAMTCTAVGKKLVIFGGGDGPAYYNDVYVLDTVNFRWSRPRIVGDRVPSKRRAHTACLYKNGIYVFGGGDGVRALNDIWRLDVSDTNKMSWKMVSGPSSEGAGGKDLQRPKARGYHTANMVGSKLIIFGGSDGGECFNDVWVYDVDAHAWKAVSIPMTFRRLSHTATIVGSYLFVIGGHDGNEYSNDVLLLNLVTMTWDRRKVYGLPPSGRGYHGTVLYDSRLLVIGGFDGSEVFGDVWMLELAVHAYYSQISHFTIEV
ncbi:putative rab9 effector protein with kelch motifs protein [Phaeoacremonium minimum UCRPA7]|uniref:Putative rab9 effector protein with kelch motifs protein n=1 Tax=Phaeoacremonium minimum (strain UCR-PA7) TaxID=1286976 RepID=R8BGY9_PHAM7|nr:putative rab9 effector protein with kelch motifs protein [Phaeoacremonium minimum UCRPA7]EON98549.1 putative rab9 effector protein with kelch motifs protein [Phaeoacremonium minimum UCRPA7]